MPAVHLLGAVDRAPEGRVGPTLRGGDPLVAEREVLKGPIIPPKVMAPLAEIHAASAGLPQAVKVNGIASTMLPSSTPAK